MPTYDAILPAGGKIDPEFAKLVGTEYKALIEIGGKTLLGRALDALAATGAAKHTVVIGPAEVIEHADAKRATFRLPPGQTGPDNIYRGLDHLLREPDASKKMLIVTTDLPFLEAGAITAFLEKCPADRDICVPLIREADFNKRFPGTTATFVKLKDDSWTTGNIFLLNAEALRRSKPHIERVFENRKSKMGMARLLGPVFVYKWLRKKLTLNDLEAKILSMLHCSGAAITDSDPALHYDIDALDDYEYSTGLYKEREPERVS
ncbi:MAG TPA: nucleotidyltransferase family protein [Fimbriimonadaceae bacterium]|nr:nucleotidyltransferase family protein [Fimbriimonadaceae bacterium]